VIVFALSTGNKVGLGVIALVWIVFSLAVSMLVPRYRPGFPKNVGAFLAVCALFFAAMLFAVFYFGKESKEGEAAPRTPAQTQTGVTETSGSATTTAPAGTNGGSSDLAAGKAIFGKGSCGGCHTLKDAGTTGTVGPDLDTLKPDEATVEHQVTNGGGAMPSYKDTLTSDEIKAVAAYVSQVAGT
jgi:cytochrome c6